MSRFDIQLDIQELRKDLEAMARQAPLIMSRALNRAGVSGRTAATKAVTADTGLASRYVSREFVLDKATRTKPVVAVTVKGARIPLIAFQARGPEPSRGRGKGVSYRLPSGRGRIPNAFIATMRSGHRGVFRRKPGLERSKRHGRPPTKPQLPIMELRGPSLPHVFEKKLDVFRTAAQESLIRNLRYEIDFANRPTGEFPVKEGA